MVWPMSYLFFKGVSDDIYDSSRLTTRPPPPRLSLRSPGTARATRVQQGSFPMVQFAWGLLMYERFNSLSVTERIRAMYSFHSCHLSHPFKGLILAYSIHAACSQRGRKRGAMDTYKGAERGMPRSHGNGGHKGNKVSGNKSLRRVGSYAS